MRESIPKLRVLPGDAESANALDRGSDEELMLLSSAGRRDAFAELAGRHLPRLTSFCAKYVGDRGAGEELAQETMVQVWLSSADYRPGASTAVFLYTIARNRCRNHRRDTSRRERLLEARPTSEQEPAQLDALLESERQRRVFEAVARLPEKLREAVLLRFDRGLDYAQIAEIVGRGEATMRSRVFLALKSLRRELGEALPEVER